MYNMLNDLSTLTTIQTNSLDKLFNKCKMLICDYIVQDNLCKTNTTSIDIGIGTVVINMQDHELNYKFIPSNDLEDMLVECIKTKNSPLVNTIEKTLSDRITKAYKDLF